MESRKYSPNNNNFGCLVASTNIFLGMKEHMDACFYDYLLGRKGVQDTHWLKKKKKVSWKKLSLSTKWQGRSMIATDRLKNEIYKKESDGYLVQMKYCKQHIAHQGIY